MNHHEMNVYDCNKRSIGNKHLTTHHTLADQCLSKANIVVSTAFAFIASHQVALQQFIYAKAA